MGIRFLFQLDFARQFAFSRCRVEKPHQSGTNRKADKGNGRHLGAFRTRSDPHFSSLQKFTRRPVGFLLNRIIGTGNTHALCGNHNVPLQHMRNFMSQQLAVRLGAVT